MLFQDFPYFPDNQPYKATVLLCGVVFTYSLQPALWTTNLTAAWKYSLVPSPSFFACRETRGALRAGKKKEGPGIQRSRMRQFFQFFSEFGYFSGHFSIFTRENVIIIGVAS